MLSVSAVLVIKSTPIGSRVDKYVYTGNLGCRNGNYNFIYVGNQHQLMLMLILLGIMIMNYMNDKMKK